VVLDTVPVDGVVIISTSVAKNGGGVEVVSQLTASSIHLFVLDSTPPGVLSSIGAMVTVVADTMDVDVVDNDVMEVEVGDTVLTAGLTLVVFTVGTPTVVVKEDTTSTTGAESVDSTTLSTCSLAKARSISMDALSSFRSLEMTSS